MRKADLIKYGVLGLPKPRPKVYIGIKCPHCKGEIVMDVYAAKTAGKAKRI